MGLLARNIPLRTKRREFSFTVDDFNGGSNVLFSQSRLSKNECYEALNLMLAEDGVLKPRWGTKAWTSATWTNRPDGFTEYRKTDGTRELIVIGDGKAWSVSDAGVKTEITGATFTSGYVCYFAQFGTDSSGNPYLYVGNGQDALARYNGSTLSTYTGLDTPTWDGTPIARTGLTTGSYTYYYQVSAVNEVGETPVSTEQSIAVNKERDDWDSSNYVTLGWADVSNAKKYIIYMADTSGYEVKLGETTASTYADDGTDVANPYIEAPEDDSTTGPKLSKMCISGNRLWGIEPDSPWRVYFSGTGVNRGNFAPSYGGGWIEIEKGGRATVSDINDFQAKAHIFLDTAEGRGATWEIQLQATEVATTTVTVPVPSKLIGSVGTPAPRTSCLVENDIYFLNKFGINILGNEPGILGVLRTNELSPKIRPFIRNSIDETSISKSCAYYYEAKYFLSVPTTSGYPNRTLVFDRERGAWIKDWSIGVSQFGEYTDSDGSTHLLGISATNLIEFSDNFQGDSGEAFTWRYVSPRFSVDKNWMDFARIKHAYVRLRNAKGAISFSFSGTGKTKSFRALKSGTITSQASQTGIGWDMVGTVLMGTTSGTALTFQEESLIKFLRVNKMLRDFQWTIEGDALGDQATIIGLAADGYFVKTGKPPSWRL
jgi:hypothetical protein